MNEDISDQALSIYQDFCEDHCNGPLQAAWDQYQEVHGEIEINTLPEKLVLGAIAHTLQVMASHGVGLELDV